MTPSASNSDDLTLQAYCDGELDAALEEIAWITRYRLADRVADHGIAGL